MQFEYYSKFQMAITRNVYDQRKLFTPLTRRRNPLLYRAPKETKYLWSFRGPLTSILITLICKVAIKTTNQLKIGTFEIKCQ